MASQDVGCALRLLRNGIVVIIFLHNYFYVSLRKQLTFGYATTGFPAKGGLRYERRNSILMMRHYPDLGSEASSVWNFYIPFSDIIW